MKKNLFLLGLVSLLVLGGCKNNTNVTSGDTASTSDTSNSSNYVPQTDLEKAFYELKNNNFTLDYTDSIANFDNVGRNEKYYFTNYAVQAEGDLGFSGIAQTDDVVFKYTIKDNEIVSGLPLINYNTGIRYSSIFEYTYGFDNLKIEDLPKEKDADGWYTYHFGNSRINDILIMAVILHLSPNSFPPVSLKFKVVKGMIIAESILLEYEHNHTHDEIRSTIYDVGTTELPLIHKYLSDGKTSKQPLDNKFYRFFTPYLSCYNFTAELDARGLGYDMTMVEKCTEEAVMIERSNETRSGILMSQGVAHQFTIRNGKVAIDYTLQNQDFEFYYSLYGEAVGYNFTDLSYSNLIGYCDDEKDNWYYIIDSQFLYIMSYIVYNEIYDENYCDTMAIEVLDYNTGEFNAYFNYYNRLTKVQLGTYKVHFKNRNATSIPEVDKYLSKGDKPSTQTKQNLSNVLNKFKGGNYSSDSLSSSGLMKVYNTESYFYEEVYGSPNYNYGALKQDGSVFEFVMINNAVTVDTSISKAMDLPGVGDFFKADNDLGYLSHFSDSLYNLDNYEVQKSPNGDEYWRITDINLSTRLFNYLYQLPSNLLPNGTGIIVSDDGDDSKLTILSNYISKDGLYKGYFYVTFYDIGNTHHKEIEKYINSRG
ncbi:MAG: hypothetical protein MJ248_00085 [Bacilli bacterium]|nr:hypothetical protein [Bacilli bacterium]